MAAPRFDELIHASTRLSIMAMAAAGAAIEFRFIRDELGVSDSVLSKHLGALEAAGYLTVRKENLGRGRRRTRVDITEEGDTAFHGHVAALDAIIGGAAGRRADTGGDEPGNAPGDEADRAARAPGAVPREP
ncbi:transcriptional regulator [Streptomonospora salina]|uniref:DNA-binding transcriptional ArsR family regulator n=1 Tax=Streptomonospora salina TaxID=104205 RepID=A0A841E3L8_9ACTN|nr:transcriptional regulator [Streptomonospora salina]MBB5997054.1 DNA-binding transcriptional ArsR family regulator [Streptomonospora salina]